MLLPAGAGTSSQPRGSYLPRRALPGTPGLTWGVGGGRRLGKGSSPRWWGGGTDLTSPGRAGVWSAGWPSLGVGGAPGGRRPPSPARVRSRLHLFTLRLAAPRLRREGEGACLPSRRPPWPIGVGHANEGARHKAAGVEPGCPSPCCLLLRPGNADAARDPA